MELVHDTISAPIERKHVDSAMRVISPKAQSAWTQVYAFLGSQDNDELFDFTLDHLIRGIEATLPAASTRPRAKRKPVRT